MTTVVDLSVALKWFIDEPGHAQALELLDRQDELYAPDCIVSEVAKSVWERVQSGQIGRSHGSAIVAAIVSGVPSLIPLSEFAEDVLQRALRQEQPIDLAFYFTCAELLKADFVTADDVVAQAARQVLGPQRVALLDHSL